MRRHVKRLLVCALVLFAGVMLFAPEVFAQQRDLDEKITSKERELRDLRKQIEEQRKKIKEIEKKAKSLGEYLRRLKKEEELTKKLIDGLAEREALLERKLDTLQVELARNEEIYKFRLNSLSRRLREMYKDKPKHMWQELLEAKDFSELLQKYKFLVMIAEQDAELLRDVREKKAEIERQTAEVTELLQEIYDSRKEKEEELRKLKENEGKQASALKKLKSKKARYEEKVRRLAQARKKLEKLIQRLEAKRLEQAKAWIKYGEKDFLSLKGQLIRPVEGEEVRGFGRFKHPEFGTVTYNTGIDLLPRPGSPVRAVARGRVEFSSTLPGYGSCIIINHGGGYYTLYAHIAKMFVREGDQVERGDLIAEVGSEESLSRNPFHFEIRRSKKALNPDEWFAR